MLAALVGLGAWALLHMAGRRPAEEGLEGTLERPPVATSPSGSLAVPGAAPADGGGASGTPASGRPTRAPRGEVRGLVVDARRLPVLGAEVTLHAVDLSAARGFAAPDGAELDRVRTEADGAFALPAPAAGLARVVARAAGLGPASALVTPAGARLTLVLSPEARLEVLVRTPDDGPILSGSVEVEADRRRVVEAVADGRALVTALAGGAAHLRVSTPDGGQGAAGPVQLQPGETRQVLVVVTPAARVAGQVLDDEGGEPIAGADVIIAAPGRALAQATTDTEGRFGPLPIGAPGDAVLVSVAAPGRAGALLPLTLPDGEQPAEVEIRLGAAARWNGRVEDEAGRPAAGVQVGYTPDGIAGRTPAGTTTDAEGRFELPAPPPPAPGRRIVLVARAGDALAALALRPDTPRPDPLVLRLARGASVRGRVLDEQGRALPDVLVRLQPAWEVARAQPGVDDRLHAINSGQAGGLSGLSAADGTFEVPSVPAGPWQLSLEMAGSARTLEEPLRILGEDLDVGALRLGGGLALEGEVLGPDGAPLAGVRVRLGSVARPGVREHAASTGPDGRFRFRDLIAERVWVQAEGAGSLRQELDLPTSDPLSLRLARGRQLTLEIEGPKGPYDGPLTVALRRPRQGEAGGYQAATRSERGAAVLLDVPPGSWRISVRAGRLVAAPEALLVVDPERDGRLTLRLDAPATLEGTLRDAAGQPVAGGELVLQGADGRAPVRTRSDGAGRFRLDGLAPGEHGLLARGAGGAPVSQRVTLVAGEPTRLDPTLAPSGGLRLLLLDERGRPAVGVPIALRAVAAGVPGASTQARSGSEGRAWLRDLPVTTLVVRARTRDGREAAQQVTVVPGRTLDVELRLARP